MTSGLAAKSILGFAQLIAILGLAIFAVAGTLDYWQGWVFACVFIGCAALVTAYLWKYDPKLLASRVKAGPGAEREPVQNVIQGLASVAFIGIIAVPALDHRFRWSQAPVAVAVLGDVLIVLGFVVIFYVFRENPFTAATIGVTTDQDVVRTGPYAIVRHPMYTGALVMLVGTPLALGSWWGLVMVVPMTLVVAWRLLAEERFLANNLPGYPAYCGMVRSRLLPFIW
jgi:protein-S-isoprenylcysteine O-methyltransferase Ste14